MNRSWRSWTSLLFVGRRIRRLSVLLLITDRDGRRLAGIPLDSRPLTPAQVRVLEHALRSDRRDQ